MLRHGYAQEPELYWPLPWLRYQGSSLLTFRMFEFYGWNLRLSLLGRVGSCVVCQKSPCPSDGLMFRAK